MDMMVRKILYFLDGTRRRYSKSQVTQDVHNDMRQLARVILDMYNDDHSLLGVCSPDL